MQTSCVASVGQVNGLCVGGWRTCVEKEKPILVRTPKWHTLRVLKNLFARVECSETWKNDGRDWKNLRNRILKMDLGLFLDTGQQHKCLHVYRYIWLNRGDRCYLTFEIKQKRSDQLMFKLPAQIRSALDLSFRIRFLLCRPKTLSQCGCNKWVKYVLVPNKASLPRQLPMTQTARNEPKRSYGCKKRHICPRTVQWFNLLGLV